MCLRLSQFLWHLQGGPPYFIKDMALTTDLSPFAEPECTCSMESVIILEALTFATFGTTL